jgi:Na+-transporting NADH:ubiquinone oxidoreductase subunit F
MIVIFLSVWFRSLLPLMYIGLPTILGGWLMPIYGLTQHAGLQENVLDHRLNCRTVYMNRVHRFLYWNMNYHLEHHMFPLVPYHALPRLHALVKDDCPVPYNGIAEAFKEIIPALLKQVKDPAYFVERKLPEPKHNNLQSDMARYFGDTRSLTDSRVTVCRVGDIPLGEVIRFDFQQKTYAVYRTENNEFYATDGFCTHGNAHLAEGVLFGNIIECAKHNGRFNIMDGSPERAPVIVGLNTYKVEVSDDKVVMILSVIEGEQPGTSEDERIFRVVSNRNITAFIKELILSPADFANFTFLPGQYVKITIPPGRIYFSDFKVEEPHYKTWVEQRLFDLETENIFYSKRNYSMANNPATEPELRFNVRLALPPAGSFVPPGAGSSYMFNLKPEDEVRLSGPYGDFLLKKSDREMIFLGGGAGMAPLRSHLSYLFETEKTKRKVSFWYGARSFSDLFYTEYFEKLEKEHPNFSFHTALSEPKAEDIWKGQVGFIHSYLHAYYLSSHSRPGEVEYYLCGPPAMIKASLEMLKSLGVSDEMIAFDEF